MPLEGKMKKRHLVVYDYGTGGVWAFISANSPWEILSKYPKLEVLERRPAWMSKAEYDHILARNTFDIDDDPPEWLWARRSESRG